MRWLVGLLALAGLAAASSGLWLPLPGLLLVETDAPAAADVALVFDGAGQQGIDAAEAWRQAGLVQAVAIVEVPIRTHALEAYWSDFVEWGLARPSPTPPATLRVIRSAERSVVGQARAALPALQALGAHSVLVPGGGLSSRLLHREVGSVLQAAGIALRLVPLGPPARDPARWYENADDRRYVLSFWLELVLPSPGGDAPDEET